jgi:thiamine-phosphate pyrophosphorylase
MIGCSSFRRRRAAELAPLPVKLIVISPELEDPRETAVLGALLKAGLERYHVRKPAWSADRLGSWLAALPADWRHRLVLHSHHGLVDEFGLAGRHWRDDASAPAEPGPGFTSRSCHDQRDLQAALGAYTAVFFGPLFPSISKIGRGPAGKTESEAVEGVLATRSTAHPRTEVIALGGITAERIRQCHDWRFDGAAVLGAIWQASNPVAAFTSLQSAVAEVSAPVLI